MSEEKDGSMDGINPRDVFGSGFMTFRDVKFFPFMDVFFHMNFSCAP